MSDHEKHEPHEARGHSERRGYRPHSPSSETEQDLIALARAHELESGKVTPKTQEEIFRHARAALS